jgi:hypothetical protein
MANVVEGTVETTLRCLVTILGNNNVFASRGDRKDTIKKASSEI